MGKFYGKAQFPQFARNSAETVPFHKFYGILRSAKYQHIHDGAVTNPLGIFPVALNQVVSKQATKFQNISKQKKVP